MRLIDADALNLDYEVDMADDWKTAHEIANHIRYAPAFDAVPVVRCRECKYLRLTGLVWRCANEIVGMICEPDDYCSRGDKSETYSLHECD